MKNLKLNQEKGKRYTGNNLGLHCHCAEDKEHFIALLRKAKEENVGTLIVNNYKSLKVYTKVLAEMSEEELREFRGIKMVPSIEMPGAFKYTNLDGQSYSIETHILGYGVDLSKEDVLERFVEQKYKSIDQEEELKRLIKIGHEIGLQFNDEDCYLDINDDNRKFAGRAFMQGLMKNMDANFCQEGEESSYKLSYELRTNWRAFQNRCVKDLNNPFYLDIASLNPSVEEVIQLIHDMGGKAYLAHPSSYFAKSGSKEDIDKAFKNTTKFARDFTAIYGPGKRVAIDGIEVYHPSYLGNMEVISEIKELVAQYSLASSGGTDIHVDKTLGEDETVSSDSLGSRVTKSKLSKFRMLRRKQKDLREIKSLAINARIQRQLNELKESLMEELSQMRVGQDDRLQLVALIDHLTAFPDKKTGRGRVDVASKVDGEYSFNQYLRVGNEYDRSEGLAIQLISRTKSDTSTDTKYEKIGVAGLYELVKRENIKFGKPEAREDR